MPLPLIAGASLLGVGPPSGPKPPQLPNVDRVANSVADGGKALADAGMSAASDVATGFMNVGVGLTKGIMGLVDQAAKGVVSVAEQQINTGKTTVDRVISDVQRGCDGVRSQVQQGFGTEIVDLLRREVEKQLR